MTLTDRQHTAQQTDCLVDRITYYNIYYIKNITIDTCLDSLLSTASQVGWLASRDVVLRVRRLRLARAAEHHRPANQRQQSIEREHSRIGAEHSAQTRGDDRTNSRADEVHRDVDA